MVFVPIKINPGINVENTPLLNEAGWSSSQLIRFFQGKIQKLGGWQALCTTALTGVCRGLLAWSDLSGVPYLGCGTNSNLEVLYSGNLYDITPTRQTSNLTTAFTTTLGSNVVTVTDTGNGASAGDIINIVTITAINGTGLVLNGLYVVQTIVNSNQYTILASKNATSAVTSGITSLFTTTNTSSTVQVTLDAHGYSVNSIYTVNVSTTVGGVVIFGQYVVQSIIDANNFTITVVGSATSSTTGYENNDKAQVNYLIPSGLVSSVTAMGWGNGGYGLGGWGIGATSGAYSPIRQWTMGAWGKYLIASPTNGKIYLWNPDNGVINNVASVISINAPVYNTGIFLSMPYQQIVAYGSTDPITGNQDKMLVRWCDISDFTDWTATVTNQAGSYRLSRGSRIIGGIQAPQFGMLWTDVGVWQMVYVGFPLVYGFNEIASGCGLIAQRAVGVLNGNVYWMSQDGFYIANGGSVQSIPCSVWDKIFYNINTVQVDKVTCAVNSYFNEVTWYYPSLSGTGENDSYVKYKTDENVWDYGLLSRTAWTNQSVLGAPIGVDGTGLIQQHETSNDANGNAMVSSATTGWFKISNGELYSFIDRIIPDFVYDGTMTITISVVNYPNDTPVTITFNSTSTTEYNITRLRGRLANITISSSDIGSFWRLGEILCNIQGAGKR
jgi:hypothetical protein